MRSFSFQKDNRADTVAQLVEYSLALHLSTKSRVLSQFCMNGVCACNPGAKEAKTSGFLGLCWLARLKQSVSF